jgi:hypothetical protein
LCTVEFGEVRLFLEDKPRFCNARSENV